MQHHYVNKKRKSDSPSFCGEDRTQHSCAKMQLYFLAVLFCLSPFSPPQNHFVHSLALSSATPPIPPTSVKPARNALSGVEAESERASQHGGVDDELLQQAASHPSRCGSPLRVAGRGQESYVQRPAGLPPALQVEPGELCQEYHVGNGSYAGNSPAREAQAANSNHRTSSRSTSTAAGPFQIQGSLAIAAPSSSRPGGGPASGTTTTTRGGSFGGLLQAGRHTVANLMRGTVYSSASLLMDKTAFLSGLIEHELAVAGTTRDQLVYVSLKQVLSQGLSLTFGVGKLAWEDLTQEVEKRGGLHQLAKEIREQHLQPVYDSVMADIRTRWRQIDTDFEEQTCAKKLDRAVLESREQQKSFNPEDTSVGAAVGSSPGQNSYTKSNNLLQQKKKRKTTVEIGEPVLSQQQGGGIGSCLGSYGPAEGGGRDVDEMTDDFFDFRSCCSGSNESLLYLARTMASTAGGLEGNNFGTTSGASGSGPNCSSPAAGAPAASSTACSLRARGLYYLKRAIQIVYNVLWTLARRGIMPVTKFVLQLLEMAFPEARDEEADLEAVPEDAAAAHAAQQEEGDFVGDGAAAGSSDTAGAAAAEDIPQREINKNVESHQPEVTTAGGTSAVLGRQSSSSSDFVFGGADDAGEQSEEDEIQVPSYESDSGGSELHLEVETGADDDGETDKEMYSPEDIGSAGDPKMDVDDGA
ncbi:unnamed protein product [Amoebophrya sp. A120]|nr:unnamed protein product [Amoebophrya sp. A120]|eukprot:GSA120T00001370001.1